MHARAAGRSPSSWVLRRIVRRTADIVAASVLLAALSPFLALIAIAIRADSPGPALFRQRRIGRGSAEFTILKFRTMRVGTPDLASHLVGPGSNRVTRTGRILRRSSIDELPQLWNVLAGDMTLVGPRPALFNQDDLIALRQEAGVDALKPGVTGWAQVNGRDEIALPEKVALDRFLTRLLAFPIGYLVFMLAFPPFVMNRLSFALKEVAVQIAAHASEVLGVTLQRGGMTLWLAGGALEIDTCSGLRSLLAMLATGVLLASLLPSGWWRRAVLVLLAVPMAIAGNALRITLLLLMAHYVGVKQALGTFHDVSGYLTYGLSLAGLLVVWALLQPRRPQETRQP